MKKILFSITLLIASLVLLSACTSSTNNVGEDFDNPSWTQVGDDKSDDKDDNSDDQASDETENDDVNEDDSSSEDESEDFDPALVGSVSGKYCYPEGDIPSSLRVYLEDAETGQYQYQIARGDSKWSFDEVEPGTYIVYLKGPEGSDLLEGRYTDENGNDKEILVREEGEVTGIEPCDFE